MSNLVFNKQTRLDGREIGQCTAWVHFDATTNPPTIKGSLNVLGITDNGVGDYTINFALNMDNENYSVNVTGNTNAGNQVVRESVFRSVTGIQIHTVNNGALADLSKVSVSILGGID